MPISSYIGPVTQCQICSSKLLEPILSLGHQPIVQEYLTAGRLGEQETTYPLNLCFCKACGLVQLDYIVDPKLVFPQNYPYRTGMTNMLIRNFQTLADRMEEQGFIKKGELIVDIGSNDGSLLKPFKQRGMRVLGVEPTGAAKVANKSGIPTIEAFFDRNAVRKIVKKYGKAKIITATNVFAHINNVSSLIANIKALMDTNSVFVSESQYLGDIIEKKEFDTIYHEHLRFYALGSLMRLFELAGMTVTDAERISSSGGSIRVYAVRGSQRQSSRVRDLLAEERKAGLHDLKRLREFGEQAIRAKHELLALLLKCKKTGGKIAGLGSPARSNTLLGFTKIDHQLIDYACEKTGSPKIGMYTPGTHIPVVDEGRLFRDQPEYTLILSWHIGKELVDIMKKRGYKGKFIVPLPKARVVK